MVKDAVFESKPLREKIADRIRTDIIKGIHVAGERLVEPKLADALGISRTPIREALRQLENEGFIEIVPRRGAVVKALTLKDIDDLYAIKANLEGLAARQAAEQMSAKDLERLKKINERFNEFAYSNPHIVDEYLKENIDFHNIFIHSSKNQKLIEILDGLAKNFQRLKSILVTIPERAHNVMQEHDKIIAALESRDPDRAERVVREHVVNGWNALKKRIQDQEG